MSNRVIKAEWFQEREVRRVDPPEPRLFFNSEADEDEPDEVIQELETEAEPEEAEPEIDPKAEAEMIINQAREEAGQILTEAIRQGESLKEQTKKEGYAQGYQEGIEAATAEMREKQAEAQRLLEEAEASYKRRVWESEGEILKLACEIAEEISRTSLSIQPEAWIGMVRKAISRVAGAKELLLRISPQDEELLNKNISAIREILTESAPIRIEVDPTLKPGDLWIETNIGQVDARIAQQIQNIFNGLRATVIGS